VAASVAVLSPSASFAQPSPYAYDDPSEDFTFDAPFSDVNATNLDPGVTGSQKPSDNLPVNTSKPPDNVPVDDVPPAVEEVTPELSVDPAAHLPMNANPLPKTANPLPKTGGEIQERICFAMLLVAAGLLALEAGRRRRVWAR
jgi:hypothetical protein